MQELSFDVCGVGSAAVDDLLYVERYPGADEKCPVLESRRRFGGLVATALAAAARLGARAAYAGVVTDDELASIALSALEREGVDCRRAIRREDGCTIHSVIVCERDRGTRTIFFSRPSAYPVGVLDVEGILRSARVLLVDQLGLEAAMAAGKAGVEVVADMEWPEREDCRALMASIDHLVVSRAFALELTGESEPDRMVVALHGTSRRRCTAVTFGAEGCRYASGDSRGVRLVPSFAVRAVETNGCGDVFHGAYAAALARGQEVDECVHYAAAAAALYASRPGGWEHLPTDGEVRTLRSRGPA